MVLTQEGLEKGAHYRFRVSAINTRGEGDYSEEQTFLCAALPSAPTQPQVVTSSETEITIEWRAPEESGGATVLEYEVFHKLGTDPETSWASIASNDINTLKHTHSGLTSDSDVQYRVRARTEAGYSPFSIRNTFGLAAVPSITQAPVKDDSGSDSVTLSWTLDSDGGSPITGFKLYQTNVTTGGIYLVYDGSNIPTVSTRRVANLTPGHRYAYQVAGLNRVGEGPKSPVSSEFYAATLPGRPEPPQVEYALGTQIGLRLTSLTDNGGSSITTYRLYVDDGD